MKSHSSRKAWLTRRRRYGMDGLSRRGERAIIIANKRRKRCHHSYSSGMTSNQDPRVIDEIFFNQTKRLTKSTPIKESDLWKSSTKEKKKTDLSKELDIDWYT